MHRRSLIFLFTSDDVKFFGDFKNTKNEKLLEEYLQLVFANLDLGFLKTRPNGGKLQKGEMMKIQFPLPDTDTQLKIVKEVSKLKGAEKWNKFEELLK